jgi:folate-binding protein YgfZ
MRSFARMPVRLDDRAVIAVSGPEAKSFLQGLITNDIAALTPDAPLYAALLTPQGKILFDFLLSEKDGAVLIDCATASVDALLKRLTMYRLRAKVELARRDDLAVFWNREVSGDPRLPVLGQHTIAGETNASGGDSRTYLLRRLDLGVPEGADFGSDKMFALDAGLEELRGVSFAKGCYIGQELTARMKHRGTARKRLLPIVAEGDAELPSAGSEIRAAALGLGEIVSVYGGRGFGLIRLDRWQEAGDAAVNAGEQDIRIVKPAWLMSSEGS